MKAKEDSMALFRCHGTDVMINSADGGRVARLKLSYAEQCDQVRLRPDNRY